MGGIFWGVILYADWSDIWHCIPVLTAVGRQTRVIFGTVLTAVGMQTGVIFGTVWTAVGMQTEVIFGDQPYGLPLTEKLMPQYLKPLGYRSHIVGKVSTAHQ